MRILIVGGGVVGYGLAQALAADHDVVVVDHDPDVAERFEKLDVEFVLGGATSNETLRRAGADRAEVFVACTALDEVNIVACGMANQLGSPETSCFVSREDFLRMEQDGLTQFGINHIVWPEAQLAADIERVVSAPDAIDAEEFAGGAIRLLEYRLQAGSPLTTAKLADVKLPQGSLVVAVRRADEFFIPTGDTRLVPGDKIVVMGTPAAMAEVQAALTASRGSRRVQLVTIIGGGDVGLRVAERLEARGHVEVRVIERDPERGALLAGRLSRALVLSGDGTDLALLEAEDVGRSDVLVSVIDNDERNLLASLLGRQLGVRRVITRVSNAANLRLFERVGIDVALSARGAAIASVLHRIQGGKSNLLAVLEQGDGRVVEVEVPGHFAGRRLRDLARPPESIIGAILHADGRATVPHGDDRLQGGDRVLVFTTRAAADPVRDFFGAARA